MADKVEVTVLKQKVFHDGLSMVVLKPGEREVAAAFVVSLFSEGVIANPGIDVLRGAAGNTGFYDAGELKRPGDDTFSQPIGAFTEEQERNLAEQSQLIAGDEDDDVEALRDRIAELEGEGGELSILRARVTELEAERDDLLAELNAGQLLDEHGSPVKPPEGNIGDPPSQIALTDDQRARLPQLDHDGDGLPGGSTTQTGDDLPALREDYEALAGKKVFNGWDAATLRTKIAELKAGADQTGDDADEADAPPA